jgi:hypothetical protein
MSNESQDRHVQDQYRSESQGSLCSRTRACVKASEVLSRTMSALKAIRKMSRIM